MTRTARTANVSMALVAVLAACAHDPQPAARSKVASQPARPAAFARTTGVAFLRGKGAELFFPRTANALRAGQRVAIIVPLAPAVLQAEVLVGTPASSKRPFLPFGSDTRRYAARLLGLKEPAMPAVGIASASRAAMALRSALNGDLDGDGTVEHFRSCTSSEGLHLTIWSGPRPLAGQRRWHAYYYLGYDTEPSCQTVEYAP